MAQTHTHPMPIAIGRTYLSCPVCLSERQAYADAHRAEHEAVLAEAKRLAAKSQRQRGPVPDDTDLSGF